MAKILIVEDDIDARNLMVALLELASPDFDVTATYSLRVACERAHEFDLIVMDFDTHDPSFNGADACRAIRGAGNQVPILIHSGSIAYWQKAKEAGATAFLMKPVDDFPLQVSLHLPAA